MILKYSRLFAFQTTLFVFSILPAVVMANSASRAGDLELTLQTRYVDSFEANFDGGASVDVNSDVGFGFGLGYNLSDNLLLRGNLSWAITSYAGSRVLDDGSGTVQNFGSDLEASTLGFGADYYFGEGKIAPFIGGTVGWTFVDTNIPSGPPSNVCWYDPWWGYVCNTSRPTFSETEFSYSAVLGLRFDVNRSVFMRASIGESYIEYDHAIRDSDMTFFQFDLGFVLD